jgi:HEAT repeat protein
MRAAKFAATALLLLALAGLAAAQPRSGTRPSDKSPRTTGRMGSLSPARQEFGGKTMADWRDELTHRDASKRAAAITAIANLGEDSSRFVPLLIDRTRDSDTSPRTKAVIVLRFVAVNKDDVPKVVAALTARLRQGRFPYGEPEAVIRYEAAATVERFAADAQRAIPALIEASRDWSNWEIRHMCVRVLVQAGLEKDRPPDRRVSEALVRRVLARGEDYQVRLEAVKGLGAMGRPDNSALREVLDALHTVAHSRGRVENMPLKIWAFTALANMNEGPEAAIAQVTGFLKHRNLEVRCQAAQALGALGKKAKGRIPQLIRMLSDKQPPAVQAACIALANIGDDSDKVIAALLATLKTTKDANVALAVCSALTQLKAARPEVFAALEDQLDRKDEQADKLRPFFRRTLKQLKNPKKEEPAEAGGAR